MGHEYSKQLWNFWSHGLEKGEGGIVAIGVAGALGRFLWQARVWAARMRHLMSADLGSESVSASVVACASWGASIEKAATALMWYCKEPGSIN